MTREIEQMLTQGAGIIIVVNSSIGAMFGRPGLSLQQATKRALLAVQHEDMMMATSRSHHRDVAIAAALDVSALA